MDELPLKSVFCERRLYPRYTVHYLCDVYLGDEVLFATVLDISENGIGITLPKEFYEGEVLNLKINCKLINKQEKTLQKINIYLRAKIVWIKEEGKMFKAGLHITDISYDDLNKLREHIEYLANLP